MPRFIYASNQYVAPNCYEKITKTKYKKNINVLDWKKVALQNEKVKDILQD